MTANLEHRLRFSRDRWGDWTRRASLCPSGVIGLGCSGCEPGAGRGPDQFQSELGPPSGRHLKQPWPRWDFIKSTWFVDKRVNVLDLFTNWA